MLNGFRIKHILKVMCIKRNNCFFLNRTKCDRFGEKAKYRNLSVFVIESISES